MSSSTTTAPSHHHVSAAAAGGSPPPRNHFVFNTLRTVEKGQYVKVFSTDVLEKVHEQQLARTSNSKENTPHSVFPSMPAQPAPQLSGDIGIVEAVKFFTLGELRGEEEEEEEEQHHQQPPPMTNNYYTTPQEQQQQRRNNQRGGRGAGGAFQQQQAYNSYNGGVHHQPSYNNNNKRHNNGYNHHHQHHHGGGSFHQNMMMHHNNNTHHHYNHFPQHQQQHYYNNNKGGGSKQQQHPSDSSLPSTIIKEVTIKARSGFSVEIPLENVRRAYLVVLDLNGILGARDKGIFVPRPNLNTFLKFIFEHFVVAVWTSGIKKNADLIISEIFGPERNYGVDYAKKLLFSWDREQTTKNPTPEKPYGTIKELSKIFDRFPESFHAANTIIVDDSPEKCTHPSLSLCPTAFTDEVARKWQEQVVGQGDTSIANTPIMLGGTNNSGMLRKQHSQTTTGGNNSTFPTSPQQAAIQKRQSSSIQMASSTKYVHFDDQEERGLQYVQRVLERVLVEDTLSPVYEAAEERLEEAYRDRKAASNSKDNTPNSLAQKETTLEQLQRMMQEARAQKVEAAVAAHTTIPQPPSIPFAAHSTTTNDYHPKQPSPPSAHHVAAATASTTRTHVLSSVGGLRCAGDNSDSEDEYYDQMIVE